MKTTRTPGKQRTALASMLSFSLFAMAICLLCTASSLAAQEVAQGVAARTAAPTSDARPHPVLVELFTSEGCASCPPADALLERLQSTQLEAGQTIVVMSEHVTYWNRSGWSDRFSRPEFDDRQNIYSGRFLLDDVYTPEIVVNGDKEMLGSDEDAVLAAIREQPTTPVAAVHILQVTPQTASTAGSRATPPARRVLLTFAVDAPVPAGAEIYAAVVDDVDATSIARGENAGRTLSHVAVARSLTRVAKLKNDQALSMTVALQAGPVAIRPSAAHADSAAGSPAQHVVLFAQEAAQGRVLSLATAAVPAEQTATARLTGGEDR